MKNNLIKKIYSLALTLAMSLAILPVTALADESTYDIYGGDSIVGETGDANKMNATYNSGNGMLTFNGPTYQSINKVVYHDTADQTTTLSGFDRFACIAYVGTADKTKMIEIDNFYVGGSNTSTDYATGDVKEAKINAYKLALDKYKGYKDSQEHYMWIQLNADNSDGVFADSKNFMIRVGKVSDILSSSIEQKVKIEIPTNIVNVTSGSLEQDVTNFQTVTLETVVGHAFTNDTITTINNALSGTGLVAQTTSETYGTDNSKKFIICKRSDSSLVSPVTVSASSYEETIISTFVLYNGTSTVGKTGDENKMGVAYDFDSGKLTFNCKGETEIEAIKTDGTRTLYGKNNFDRFYVVVNITSADGQTQKFTKGYNVGGRRVYPDDYGSFYTRDPYLLIKMIVQEQSNLDSTDVVTVAVNACNPLEQIDSVNGTYTFTIDAGTVEDIVGKKVQPTPTPTSETKKSSGGWDDGGPFTTDTCGNVFDRWGNKIYEAKGCNVGGYNLVRTSVED